MIIFEQGDIAEQYPQIDLKMLMLRILNQRVISFNDIPDSALQTLFYDYSAREIGKGEQPSQIFTFMIDESAGVQKPKS
jgi:hypothetical protein